MTHLDLSSSQQLCSPADWIVDPIIRGKKAITWLYIYPQPNEAGMAILDEILKVKDVLYLACSFEINTLGQTVFLLLITIKGAKSHAFMQSRFGLSQGLLLSKQSFVSTPDVIHWLRGPDIRHGLVKPFNPTFREMRREGYIMRGRDLNVEFLQCQFQWLNSFAEILRNGLKE